MDELSVFGIEDLFDEIDQSVSGKDDPSLSDWSPLDNVLLWHHLIFTLFESIINIDGDLERFVLELFEVNSFNLRFVERELSDKVVSEGTKIEPCVLGERSLWVLVVRVDDVVPDGMKLVCGVVVLESESVSTFVSFWKFLGVSVTAVERLVNVSHVVDNESQSKGLSFVLAAMDSLQFHHGLVSDGV